MEKTVVVAVNSLFRHRLYQRTVRRTKKFMAHDEQNNCHVGDLVKIQESRPVSKHKHWRVIDVLEVAAQRGKAVDIPVAVAGAGVPDIAAAANADVTPGVLAGTGVESRQDQRDAEAGGQGGHR
jgi:small subunit ribosomal protein S17